MKYLGLKRFNKMLTAKRLPFYAHVRFEPEKLPKFYRFVSMTYKMSRDITGLATSSVVRIKSAVQERLYKACLNLPIKGDDFYPYVIGISSIPNDNLALETASCILWSLLKKNENFDWLWLDAARYDIYDKDSDTDFRPKLVIISNVIPDKQRARFIRDILCKYPRAIRILVIAGRPSLSYFNDYISHGYSGLMHVIGSYQEKSIRFCSADDEDDGNDTTVTYPHGAREDFDSLLSNLKGETVRFIKPKKE